MCLAYAGNLPAASAKDGKFAMLISVGTRCTPRSAATAMVSSVRPVPCSMQSTPAASSPGRASSPNTWVVTLAPPACATATASASMSSGQSGARSPTDRSIQSPTILIHGRCRRPVAARPRRAGPPDPPGRHPARGCTGGHARCAGRPGPAPAGRPGRPASWCPAGNRSPAAPVRRRRGSSWPAAPPRRALPHPRWRVSDMAVRVDEPGQHIALQLDGVFDRVGDRSLDEPAVHRPQIDPLAGRRGRSPVTWRAVILLLRELELRRVEARRQLVEPESAGRRCRTGAPIPGGRAPIPGKPAGMPLTFGGVGPRPVERLPLRPFAAFRLDGRAPGNPNRPAIEDIILRASKNRSTRALTCATVEPEPLGDALPPGGVDDLRFGPLGRRHGLDDGGGAVDVAIVDVRERFLHLPRARAACPSRPPIGPILRIIIICWRKSSRVKSLPAILAAIASA